MEKYLIASNGNINQLLKLLGKPLTIHAKTWLEKEHVLQIKNIKACEKKKEDKLGFRERDCLLSGQKSDTSSRLLYDGLTSLLGSARSSTLRPRNDVSFKKVKKIVVEKKCTFSRDLYCWGEGSLSLFLSKEIALFIDRSRNISRRSSSIRIDMSLWASDYACLFLYVLTTSVSAPKKKV